MSGTEEFWRGCFGHEYTNRNAGADLIKAKEALFRKALTPLFWHKPRAARIIEFGANRGLNLIALARITSFADVEFTAVEINGTAIEELHKLGVKVVDASMTDPAKPWGNGYDLSLSIGVLIHVQPELLPAAYDALYESSQRYILIAEYFSPNPVEIEYRGEGGRLWKRNFAGEMMDRFPDLKMADYGFVSDRDPYVPLDNINWYLLQKPNGK